MLFKGTFLGLILSCFIWCGCGNTNSVRNQPIPQISIDSFNIPNTTIRAMHVVSESEVWFAGSNGKWGYTKNGGITWQVDSIEYQGNKLEFRSIAMTKAGDLFLVSVAEPALILKSSVQNLNWRVVYQDTNQGAFLDMIQFQNDRNGILLGDPKNGCFQLATTQDGGETWTKITCNHIPMALSNEAPFAASNSNLDYIQEYIWFATGGKTGSRIYSSKDAGIHWNVVNTPIVKGGTMTGIYSLDFYNQQIGIVAGGNWDSIAERTSNIALTKDSGKTWQLKSLGLPYISCVQFIPNLKAEAALLLSGRGRPGESHIYYYDLVLDTAYSFSNTNYLSLQFANDHVAWISGRNKIGRLHIYFE